MEFKTEKLTPRIIKKSDAIMDSKRMTNPFGKKRDATINRASELTTYSFDCIFSFSKSPNVVLVGASPLTLRVPVSPLGGVSSTL